MFIITTINTEDTLYINCSTLYQTFSIIEAPVVEAPTMDWIKADDRVLFNPIKVLDISVLSVLK